MALVDAPTSELHTTAFVAEAEAVCAELQSLPAGSHVGIEVVAGEELLAQGMGGLYNVGKAASHPPALVVLSHAPPGASRSVVWAGKGIVYDTGGLSIKAKEGMPGMKSDMGGAAAVLAAFDAAVRAGPSEDVALHGAPPPPPPANPSPPPTPTRAAGPCVCCMCREADTHVAVGLSVAVPGRELHLVQRDSA
eukprot:COSAG04_NODE_2103_length_4779_cov_3.468162_4_plen_193_part_00